MVTYKRVQVDYIIYKTIILIVLFFLSACNDKIEKSKINQTPTINKNIVKFDKKNVIEELKSYKEDGTLNTYIYFDTLGRIDYDYSFFLNIYPSEDTLYIDKKINSIYLHYYDYRGTDSIKLHAEYIYDEEVFYKYTLESPQKETGVHYKIKQFNYKKYSIHFMLDSYSSTDEGLFILRMKKVKWVVTNS